MFLPTLPQPDDVVLQIEQHLDKLEPQYPPSNPTSDNPLGIDHFDLLGGLHAASDVNELKRHYMNALRQYCAGQRDMAAVHVAMDRMANTATMLTKKCEDLEALLKDEEKEPAFLPCVRCGGPTILPGADGQQRCPPCEEARFAEKQESAPTD